MTEESGNVERLVIVNSTSGWLALGLAKRLPVLLGSAVPKARLVQHRTGFDG